MFDFESRVWEETTQHIASLHTESEMQRKALPECRKGRSVLAHATPEHAGPTLRRHGLPTGRKLSKRVAFDMLDRVANRGNLSQAVLGLINPHAAEAEQSPPPPQQLRFPSIEFRSLCLNPLAKSGLHPFPDRGTWNRHKVELAGLVLMLAAGCSSYQERLEQLVEASLERETFNLRKTLRDPLCDPEERERLEKKYETRRSKVQSQFELWCEATVKNPNFQLLKPVLEKVLEVDPAPQIDNKRDGQRTEQAISILLERELPPGWTMHTQCRIVAVDDEPFRNEKMVKGECDVLLTDCQGIVQAILEIKTAKGNPYLALYEDLQRFRNMTERVRGRLVAFAPGHGLPPGTVHPGVAVAGTAASQGIAHAAGGAGGAGDQGPNPVVTLRFSKNVRPIYVLGNDIAAEDLGAVVRSAQSKLITMEFGRILSTQIDAWKDVSVVEINREAAILQVPHHSFPECASNVRRYFENLQTCDIFTVQCS